MTTRAMRQAGELQQVLFESEAALSQSSMAISLFLVVVTVSASSLQEPPQVLTVEEAQPETPFVANAQSASVLTDK